MNKPFSKILVESNGVIINIKDLPKEHYEYFLDLTHELRIAYKVLSEKR